MIKYNTKIPRTLRTKGVTYADVRKIQRYLRKAAAQPRVSDLSEDLDRLWYQLCLEKARLISGRILSRKTPKQKRKTRKC